MKPEGIPEEVMITDAGKKALLNSTKPMVTKATIQARTARRLVFTNIPKDLKELVRVPWGKGETVKGGACTMTKV